MRHASIKKVLSATKRFDFAIKAYTQKDGSAECVIEGYANTVDKDRVGDVVMPVAFEKSLPTYLKNPVLLCNHDWNDVCGVVLEAKIDEKGLFIRAKISDAREDIKTMVREGCLRTLSIGYNEVDSVYDDATKTKVIKELELLEISVVAVPANPEAIFAVKKDEVVAPPVIAASPAKAADEGCTCMHDAVEKLKTEGYDPDLAAAKAYHQNSGKVCCGSKKFALGVDQLTASVELVQKAYGEPLGTENVVALCDLLNSQHEEFMKLSKKELMEKLRATLKSAGLAADPVAAPADAKADPAAPAPKPEGDKPAADSGDFQKQVMEKLNALAQGMMQLMESMGGEEKPADEGKGEPAPAATPAPAAAAAPAPKAGEKPADQKDLTAMSDTEIAEIEAEIDAQLEEIGADSDDSVIDEE